MGSLKGQLTLRGILIGCIGCVVITTASIYTALRMGALPWPILFAAIVSLFFLKLLGKTSLNEVNVTHTIMSAGAMVAGGLAFTIPGIWILGAANDVDWQQMLIVALSGVILGLICTVFLRRHFIEKAGLEYPLGEAAAQTLIAGNTGGKIGKKLFGAMSFAGIYTALRDWFALIPQLFLSGIQIPGVAFGIYNSPMLLAIGFIVGTGAVIAWFVGALIGNFGIITGGSFFGLWDIETGRDITSSLGMGLMMGCGIAIVLKVAAPAIASLFKSGKARSSSTSGATESPASVTTGYPADAAPESGPSGQQSGLPFRSSPVSQTLEKDSSGRPGGSLKDVFVRRLGIGAAAFLTGAVALILCFALGLGVLPSIIIVVFAWVTTAMSAQSVGQTGIDPMEIFGLIVLLIVAVLSDVSQVQLFFVAGVIAVACGLTGDLMNDFMAGHRIGTDPRAQWIGQAIGGILGALIAVATLVILVQAYGTDAFGPNGTFIATQASIVATMISGIPSVPAFVFGLAAGCILYFLGIPAMMVGLGVYLPFFMSFTAFIGMLAKLAFDFVGRRRLAKLTPDEASDRARAHEETGLIISSGFLGGESIVGVVIALISISMFLM